MQPLDPNDLDLMTRLVVAENNKADPTEQAAIAHVMLNRYASGGFGGSMQDVLNARTKGGGYQFTPLGTTNNSPYKVDPSSPAYQQARQVVEGAAAGSIPDPTNGATYYRNQAIAPGRPAGVAGVGVKIGAHTFFGGSQTAMGDLPPDKYGTDADPLVQKYAATATGGTLDPKDYGTDNDPLVQKYGGGQAPQASGSLNPKDYGSDADPLVQKYAPPPATPTTPNQTVAQDFASFPGATNQEASYAPMKFEGDLRSLIQQHPRVAAAMVGGMNLPIAAGGVALLPHLIADAAWPLVKKAAPYFAADEAVRHGESAYQYGRAFLNSFQE